MPARILSEKTINSLSKRDLVKKLKAKNIPVKRTDGKDLPPRVEDLKIALIEYYKKLAAETSQVQSQDEAVEVETSQVQSHDEVEHADPTELEDISNKISKCKECLENILNETVLPLKSEIENKISLYQ